MSDLRTLADAVMYEGYMLWPYRRERVEEPAALDVRVRLPAGLDRGCTPTTPA